MSEVLLEIRHVVVDHRHSEMRARSTPVVRAVDDVSLRVHAGEVVAVVGASGAGKSTLARAALALLRSTSGAVAWSPARGAPLVDVARQNAAWIRAARPRFQPVFQDPVASLDPRWTVRAILHEALDVRASTGDAREDAVRALLVRVGLGSVHLDRTPNALSGGEAQRVCLARALATDPDLLVLDEPVAALDASIQAQVLDLLQDLRRERELAFLLVAHDMALVEWMADRVVVIERGRIVEEGPAVEVLRAPQHPITRELTGAASSLH